MKIACANWRLFSSEFNLLTKNNSRSIFVSFLIIQDPHLQHIKLFAEKIVHDRYTHLGLRPYIAHKALISGLILL